MKKLLKSVFLMGLAGALVFCGVLIGDKKALQENVIRLHVVANSDSEEDQSVKLQVRDAVLEFIARHTDTDAETARRWLEENLAAVEEAANAALEKAGAAVRATVELGKEAFPLRSYDTFSLPSGVYESLRITLGEGEGQNWWCVIFPSLCVSASTEAFADTAAGAGFSDGLTGAIQGDQGYEIRFFFLDWLGKVENFFFGR